MSTFPHEITRLQPFFGGWMLDSLIGKGSFGQVYRIVRTTNGNSEYAALKWITIPKDEQAHDEVFAFDTTQEEKRAYYKGMVNNLLKEVQLMHSLSGHPNIVSIMDDAVVAQENGIGYNVLILMELLIPLTASIMPERDVIKMGLDLCTALSACHAQKILHRDIKPANIFIDAQGNYKLGDFGVARQIESTMGGTTHIGTPLYMAPEMHLAGAGYGATVDLYALGLVMHRYLNRGRIPFIPVESSLPTPAEMDTARSRRQHGEAIPPAVDASPALNAILAKACAFRPEDRYQSVGEMWMALSSITHTQTLPKEPAKKVADPEETVGLYDDARTPPAYAETAAETVAATAAPESTPRPAPQAQEAKSAPRPAPSPTATAQSAPAKKKNTWRNVAVILVAVIVVIGAVYAGNSMNRPTDTVAPSATAVVTEAPTPQATAAPTMAPTVAPTVAPTMAPTAVPTAVPTVAPVAIVFPNEESEVAVRGALKMPSGEITTQDALRVTELEIHSTELSDISFLSHFTNLTYLELRGNDANPSTISDVTPLQDLTNLEVLSILYFRITDISFLQHMKELKDLSLDPLEISDITVLQNLTNLECLYLHSDEISDITPLKNLKNLIALDLWGNNISDITPLQNLTNLTELHLWGNNISDITPLQNLTNLTKLLLFENNISDIAPLQNLTNLEMLDLRLINISDITPLQNLKNLIVLHLWGNNISDITPLQNLTNLTELHLFENNISDIAPLQNLTNLETLDLRHNNISDRSPLDNLPNLTTLKID